MTCPKCGSDNRRCIDSRPAPGNQTRRRHECVNCGARWSTLEKIIGVGAPDLSERCAVAEDENKRLRRGIRQADSAMLSAVDALYRAMEKLEEIDTKGENQ